MSRTQDLVLARLRLIAMRWQGGWEAAEGEGGALQAGPLDERAWRDGALRGGAPGRPRKAPGEGQSGAAASGVADSGKGVPGVAESGVAGSWEGESGSGESGSGESGVAESGEGRSGQDESGEGVPGPPARIGFVGETQGAGWPAPIPWLRLLALLVLVVSLGGAALTFVAWPREQASGTTAQTTQGASDLFADPFPPASPSPAVSLQVHVVGDVRHPGVVRLPAGSRVVDAVKEAGGLRRGGELGSTNLARVLVDGERIEVGAVESPGSAGSASAGTTSSGPLDLNSATAEQLDTLPGIGPVTAAKILGWRTTNGRFTAVDELAEVPGIGPKTLAELVPMSESEPRPKPDLRLAPLVGGLWAGELAVLLVLPVRPERWATGAGVLLVLGLLCSALGAGRRSFASRQSRSAVREWPVGGMFPARAVLLGLAACGLLLGVAVGAAHLARLHPPELVLAAERGAAVAARATVTGDPVVRVPADDGGRPSAPSWSLPARLSAIEIRGHRYEVRVPVLLQGDQVRDLRYGTGIALSARAAESWTPQAKSMTLRVLGDIQVRSPPGVLARATTRVREAFREACSGLPPDAAALLLGLAVGDESLLAADLDDAMVRSGLAHLTAVSGANTALVVGIAMAVVTALGVGWRIRVATCLVVLSGYVLLVRPQPSVLRAAAMGVVALVALSAGGRRRGPPALLASALVLLLVLPEFAVSLGFALSFAATAGLLVVGPPIADRLGRWPVSRWAPEPIRAALAVAAAAHLATLPLAVLMGNGASLVALPANVLVGPLVPVATVLGLAAALVAPALPGLAHLLAALAAPATAAIASVARLAARTPFGVLDVPGGPAGALGAAALLGLLAIGAARRWRPWRHRRLVVAVTLTAVLVAARLHARNDRWPPPGWIVLACDVGQGDGLLIREQGSTEALLVDAGPDPDAISDCIGGTEIERLAVLVTHFHADHIGGLAAVLARWPVSVIIATPVPEPETGALQVVDAAREAGVPIRLVRSSDRLRAGGVDLAILWPVRRMDASPANNASVVAVASLGSHPTGAGQVRALLTGDIEPEAQAVLMAGQSPGAEIVKVPHHGSRYQVSSFARWSGARIALVSAGRDNDYGHPSPKTIDQYGSAGARVGRTDHQGELAVVMTDSGPALVTQH